MRQIGIDTPGNVIGDTTLENLTRTVLGILAIYTLKYAIARNSLQNVPPVLAAYMGHEYQYTMEYLRVVDAKAGHASQFCRYPEKTATDKLYN